MIFRPALIVGALPTTLLNGTTADATKVQGNLQWIVDQVNANAAPLANTALLNANNNFTSVQSGIAAASAANFPIASQVQNQVFNTLSSNLGTNAITARVAALPLAAYAVGQVFTFLPTQRNTGSATLNIDALGSGVLKSYGQLLMGGELGSGAASVRVSAIGAQPILDLLNPKARPPAIGTFTRDISTASGNQSVTGLGGKPKWIMFAAAVSTGAAQSCVGVDDGTNRWVWNNLTASAAGTFQLQTASSLILQTSGGDLASAIVASFDTDGFTLTWTKTGAPTSTATIGFVAFF